jgi:putrescine aminotransferase
MELADGRVLRHGFTYNAHPVGAAVAMANLDIIEQEDLLARVRESGQHLGERLAEVARIDGVAEVRGEGLMWAVELVDGDAFALAAEIRSRGVVVRGMERRLTLSPPLTIAPADLDVIVDALGEALTAS